MELIPYSEIPTYESLSHSGKGRAKLIEREYSSGILQLSDDINIGDRIGFLPQDSSPRFVSKILPQDSSSYRVVKMARIRLLSKVDLHKMNRSGCFILVGKSQRDILQLIELSLFP